MIRLEKEVIEKIIAECKSELKTKKEISFELVDEVSEKIPIFKCGIVYFIFSNDELKYIGKSKGKYFRQRIKSHFFGIGKGTKSKHNFISNEKGKATLKYLELEPESLRNLVEEYLIEDMETYKKWNNK